jgi:Tol biopolymer transport system component
VIGVLVSSLTGIGGAGAERQSRDANALAGPYRNGLIVYVQGPPGVIETVRANGTGRRSVIARAYSDAPLTPAWSPDGKQIAYSPGPPQGGIWVMQANGRKAHRVTLGQANPDQSADEATWSPDGKSIAFADMIRGQRQEDIFRVGANGKDLKRLTTSPAQENDPAWGPNGEIVYQRGANLWGMDAQGSHQHLLIANAASASWSPGGTHLAFVRSRMIQIAARNGTGARIVVHLPDYPDTLAWSPDGRWLVTCSSGRGNLMLVRTDGSNLHALTHEPDLYNFSPSWQRLPRR